MHLFLPGDASGGGSELTDKTSHRTHKQLTSVRERKRDRKHRQVMSGVTAGLGLGGSFINWGDRLLPLLLRDPCQEVYDGNDEWEELIHAR